MGVGRISRRRTRAPGATLSVASSARNGSGSGIRKFGRRASHSSQEKARDDERLKKSGMTLKTTGKELLPARLGSGPVDERLSWTTWDAALLTMRITDGGGDVEGIEGSSNTLTVGVVVGIDGGGVGTKGGGDGGTANAL